MNETLKYARFLLSASIVCGCVQESSPGNDASRGAESSQASSKSAAIRLSGVHELLSLPAPRGSNRNLTAYVTGGEAVAVWLATVDSSTTRVPLVPVGDGEFQVNLHGQAVHEALKEHPDGEFRVFADMTNGARARSVAVRYVVATMLKGLALAGDKVTLTVHQRSSRAIPGSNEQIYLRLGDISASRVLVTVSGPGSKTYLDKRPMRTGDLASISLDQKKYVLVLDQLVNLFAGNDYAVFSIMPEAIWENERQDRLLASIASSDVVFIRTGEEIKSGGFAELLRKKLHHVDPRLASYNDFIDYVAGQSWNSGELYRVRLPNGDETDADAWIRMRATEIDLVGSDEHDSYSNRQGKAVDPQSPLNE